MRPIQKNDPLFLACVVISKNSKQEFTTTMFKSLRSLFSSVAHDVPSLPSRIASRTSDFQLISLRPYMENNGELNMKKPFAFPVTIKTVDEVCIDSPVYFKETIGCADEIVVSALNSKHNMEIKAHGIDLTVPNAIMEASRYNDAEYCKYIVFEHPIHKLKKKSSIVLKNSAAPPDSNKVMVVSLVPVPVVL